MRLRNDCTDHNRTIRRPLRIALAMALASSAWASVRADSPLPSLPSPLPIAAAVEPELLPYPFGKTGGSPAVAQVEAVSRDGTSRQLVQLLGLKRQPQPAALNLATARTTAHVEHSHLPSLALPSGSPRAQLPSSTAPYSPVVTASANEEQTSATVQLPTLPGPTAPAATSLSESLLDIEIPDDLILSHSSTSPKTPASPACIEDSGQSKPIAAGENRLPARSADQLLGIVQACEPPALDSTTILPQSSAAAAGKGTKQPDIVRTAKPMSLTVIAPEAPKSRGAVSMNLNDSLASEDAAAKRGAVLHLSSGSDDAEQKTLVSTSQRLPTPPKVVAEVRSQPAPAKSVSESDRQLEALVQPAAPLPMLETVVSSAAPSRPAGMSSSISPVKAVLASRTTPVVTSPDNLSDRPVSLANRQTGQVLSVGLQESHTLSTAYSIAELSVEHPNICQLLKTSDRSVSVIGMRPGATRIALISYDGQGERTVDVREVAVGESAPTAVNLPDLVKEISHTVARMYPKSDVQIIAYQDYVMVRGYTNYESDAKKILALVRKTSLAPVVDQLTTSGN